MNGAQEDIVEYNRLVELAEKHFVAGEQTSGQYPGVAMKHIGLGQGYATLALAQATFMASSPLS